TNEKTAMNSFGLEIKRMLLKNRSVRTLQHSRRARLESSSSAAIQPMTPAKMQSSESPPAMFGGACSSTMGDLVTHRPFASISIRVFWVLESLILPQVNSLFAFALVF